jgi:large subunit ribosomal protein L12
MEYVYAALVLHEAGKEVDEENVTAVLEAANVTVERSRVAALVAALEDIDIAEAVRGAGAPAAPAAAAPAAEESASEEADADAEPEAEDATTEEAETDDEEEPSGEGLGDLFG